MVKESLLDNSHVRNIVMLNKKMKLLAFSVVAFSCIVLMGCRDLSIPTLPNGMQSPETYHSRAGGLSMAETALRQFRDLWRDAVLGSGLITDELAAITLDTRLDQRLLIEPLSSDARSHSGFATYQKYHQLRGQARIARSILAGFAPDISSGVIARLYAFEGYAEIWLADLFCSGVPLSTIDFRGDYTYQTPSTTHEIYSHAVLLFDSAIALASDSAAVATLARIGKGRAMLGMAQYNDAERAVMGVGVNDAYLLKVLYLDTANTRENFSYTVSDQEGSNGIPYISSGDPRTRATLLTSSGSNDQSIAYFPTKYLSTADSVLVPIASGIEAQLVRAEAALNRNEYTVWIGIINGLRTNGSYDRIDTILNPETSTIVRIDTIWSAGLGGQIGLAAIDDPGNDAERLQLHFYERAAWLFMGGHRQGDLRRLVREYGMAREEVYPGGVYIGGGGEIGMYGSDITVPIPYSERRNPLFEGCINRD